jgi:hypothetical protein
MTAGRAAVPGAEPALAPRLAAALKLITVSEDGRRASVKGQQIHAGGSAELEQRLARHIYEVLHVGRNAPDVASGRPVGVTRDADFEASLLAAMPHREVIREAVFLGGGQSQVLAELEGVKVRVSPSEIAGGARQLAARGRLRVRVPAGRPALSPGFCTAEGRRPVRPDEPIVRVYAHLRTPAAAGMAWGLVLTLLDRRGLRYRAKVSSRRDLLPRRDALVVYLAAEDLSAAGEIARSISQVDEVGRSVSIFAEQIGAGVAIGWEPTDRRPGTAGLSFGEHRALAVAHGLTRHALSRPTGLAGSAAAAVRRSLLHASIDPANPARNVEPSVPALS